MARDKTPAGPQLIPPTSAFNFADASFEKARVTRRFNGVLATLVVLLAGGLFFHGSSLGKEIPTLSKDKEALENQAGAAQRQLAKLLGVTGLGPDDKPLTEQDLLAHAALRAKEILHAASGEPHPIALLADVEGAARGAAALSSLRLTLIPSESEIRTVTGSVEISLRSDTYDQVAQWVDALGAVDALADANTTWTGTPGGPGSLLVSISTSASIGSPPQVPPRLAEWKERFLTSFSGGEPAKPGSTTSTTSTSAAPTSTTATPEATP